MTWIQGSFRGEKFRTVRASTTLGQRRGVYELPYDSQGAASINLGRRARRFSIEAFLIRQDYESDRGFDLARDAFIKAIDAPDPGLLVHPTLGSVMVVPGDDVEITERSDALGMVEIRFTAVESRAALQQGPVVTPSARAGVTAAVARLNTAAAADLATKVKTSGYPAFLATTHIAAIDSSLTSLRSLNGFISAQLSFPGRIASQLDAIADQIVSLAYAPDRLYAELQNAMEIVHGAIAKVASATLDNVAPDSNEAARVDARRSAGSAALVAASTDTAAAIVATSTRETPARIQERINLAADRVAVRAAQFAALALALNELEYDSRREANAILAAALVRADQLLADDALAADVFDAVDEVRALLQSRLRNLSLRKSTDLQLTHSVPASVLAFRLYGDAERGDEIAARNGVAHPDFLPGAGIFEVLIS